MIALSDKSINGQGLYTTSVHFLTFLRTSMLIGLWWHKIRRAYVVAFTMQTVNKMCYVH